MTTPVIFVLILMYWGSDGRAAMTSVEFNSQATCEAAKKAAAKEMDSTIAVMGNRTYSVCVAK